MKGSKSIAYIQAFKNGKTPEQIAEFYEVTARAVIVALSKAGLLKKGRAASLSVAVMNRLKRVEGKVKELENKVHTLIEKDSNKTGDIQ